jgi:hypothetical protein
VQEAAEDVSVLIMEHDPHYEQQLRYVLDMTVNEPTPHQQDNEPAEKIKEGEMILGELESEPCEIETLGVTQMLF